jgi:hypothetical protein
VEAVFVNPLSEAIKHRGLQVNQNEFHGKKKVFEVENFTPAFFEKYTYLCTSEFQLVTKNNTT